MAAFLLHLVLFCVFIVLTYLLSYYPTNKFQFALKELTRYHELRTKIESQLKPSVQGIVFNTSTVPEHTTIHLKLDSKKNEVVARIGANTYKFNLGDDGDLSTLLPILLLSK